MLPIKFRLNPTYGLGGDVVWRISRWPPWWPSWIPEQNDFSNSESLCPSDTSHQVLAWSDFWFGRRSCLKNFKMAAILAIRMEWFKQFWISMLPLCLLLSFSSIQLMVLEEMSKMWKAIDVWTDGWRTDDGWTTDNRPWHKLTLNTKWANKTLSILFSFTWYIPSFPRIYPLRENFSFFQRKSAWYFMQTVF